MRGRSDAVMLRTSRTRLIISVMTLMVVPLRVRTMIWAKPMPFCLSIWRRFVNFVKPEDMRLACRVRYDTLDGRELFWLPRVYTSMPLDTETLTSSDHLQP